MNVIFADDELDKLETEIEYVAKNVPQGITKICRKRMQYIRSAEDERDFYKMKSLRFEKLDGKRKHQHSMRFNDQYRLIVELIEENSRGKTIKIVGIEDYH